MSLSHESKKVGHVCPPSTATHPSGRWETMFVYSFICRFTSLRGRIEGLDSPMDLENALLLHEPNPILTQILGQFILNLRPQTRNLSTDQISTTVANVLSEYFKSSERTIFWNDDYKINVDPFEGMVGGFFATDWDFKLKILRQLVELQLCHTQDIKNTIDRAWGVVHNKHKKKDASTAPPDPTDPLSQERLQLVPLGQDSHRRRFWVADDSPRIYVSTNPWKTTATFQNIASTREEYLATIDDLKASAPPETKGTGRKSKFEQSHLSLITALENRLEAIDAELARVARARRKIEQRNNLLAQSEIRETRTRRQTQRPDYVYSNDADSEEDADEYTYQEDEEYDDLFEEDDFLNFRADGPNGSSSRRSFAQPGRRRSSRSAVQNANGKRAVPDTWSQWRGERRSSRLGAPPDTQLDSDVPSLKRARTEESTVSTDSIGVPSVAASGTSHGPKSGLTIKVRGAAAVRPTETAVEQLAGRKKSKFWYYAVEPVSGAAPIPPLVSNGRGDPCANGDGRSDPNSLKSNGNADTTMADQDHVPSDSHESRMDYEKSLERSLSPALSLDSA